MDTQYTRIKVQVVFSGKVWPQALQALARVQIWFWEASKNRIFFEFEDPVSARISKWPARVTFTEGMEARSIEENFYREAIGCHADGSTICIFVASNAEWKANGMDYMDANHQLQAYCYPVVDRGVQIACGLDEDEMSLHYPELDGFTDYVRHELCHALYKLAQPQGFDLTHKHFYDERKPENVFDDGYIDYNLLAERAQKVVFSSKINNS